MSGFSPEDGPALRPTDIAIERSENAMKFILPEVQLHVKNAVAFKACLTEATTSHEVEEVVINMDNVSFIDTTSLGVLIGLAQKMRNRGERTPVTLEIAQTPNDEVYKVFERTGLNRIFNILPPREE